MKEWMMTEGCFLAFIRRNSTEGDDRREVDFMVVERG